MAQNYYEIAPGHELIRVPGEVRRMLHDRRSGPSTTDVGGKDITLKSKDTLDILEIQYGSPEGIGRAFFTSLNGKKWEPV